MDFSASRIWLSAYFSLRFYIWHVYRNNYCCNVFVRRGNYYIHCCKFFFKDLIKEKLTNKFEYIKNKIQKYEFYTILLYRFIGGIPFQIANLLPVLFNVQLKNYFLSTFLGIIPQVFIISSLGSGLESIIEKNIEPPSIMELVSSFEIYVPILYFLFLLIIVFALRKLFYKN